MVLKQKRDNSDILIVDASKGYEKVGKNNKLRASDIKKIVDTVINREDVEKYSKVVSRQIIRDNEYNLNIPRYIDSSPEDESFDIYATMFGGIPKYEIDKFQQYWETFPTLKASLFDNISCEYTNFKSKDINKTITQHNDIKKFIDKFNSLFKDFKDWRIRLINEYP